eukprot:INCI6395.1.p1 GENE.INCI6395.1~~INCI6395.1.p1  ORF type:complete len:137 (+),score=35.44 INCI6395.1:135-545(+)
MSTGSSGASLTTSSGSAGAHSSSSTSVQVSKQCQRILNSMKLLEEDLAREEESIYTIETQFIENQIGSGQIRWEAILDNTKSTTADFATKLFEKARVATLSSSTSRYFEQLVQAEAEEAANAASTRRRTKKKLDGS